MPHQSAHPIGGTQSFVHTLTKCWRRPSLTGLEVLWRWMYGAPAAALIAYEAVGILRANPVDWDSLRQMTVLDPMASAETLGQAAALVGPPALHVAEWLAPLLLVVWVIASALGRTVVLRHADARLHRRPLTLMALHAVRLIALLCSFAVWFWCLHWAASVGVSQPIAQRQEPNLVLFCALVIVATLGLFTAWALSSWSLSVAPLLAMSLDLGAVASLRAAFAVGPLKAKLAEINLVMGIVKIALIVLAMVFSATPLPFESVATPDFMLRWYVGVAVVYLVASDFFHIVRLISYADLWDGNSHSYLMVTKDR